MSPKPSLLLGVCALLLGTLSSSATPVRAQDATSVTQPPPSTSIVIATPQQGSMSATTQRAWFERDLEEAQTRIRRTRNALIGTSAGFAVGVILAGIGASQCQWIDRVGDENDEWLCNNTGDVLVPLGGSIAGLSAIGMLTSGIMLGVANKRRRQIEQDIRRSYGRRLRWDIPTSRLVF